MLGEVGRKLEGNPYFIVNLINIRDNPIQIMSFTLIWINKVSKLVSITWNFNARTHAKNKYGVTPLGRIDHL